MNEKELSKIINRKSLAESVLSTIRVTEGDLEMLRCDSPQLSVRLGSKHFPVGQELQSIKGILINMLEMRLVDLREQFREI
jgi:hypothetical protein